MEKILLKKELNKNRFLIIKKCVFEKTTNFIATIENSKKKVVDSSLYWASTLQELKTNKLLKADIQKHSQVQQKEQKEENSNLFKNILF